MGALEGVLEAVEGWGAGAVAVGVLDCSGVLAVHGDPERPYALASVTKLFTTYALLLAVEEGTCALDEPAGPPGATLAHLLAHASGCAPDMRGQVLAAPGSRRIYSNVGFELAAELLEERSGMAFGDYLRSGVLGPLGAVGLDLEGSPARDASGSLADLLALAAELLSPRLLDPATVAHARQVAFPGLSGVLPGFGRQNPCDWGLGFELRDHKAPHWTGSRCSPATFGHFGQSGTFLWVDPEAGVACAALCEAPFGPWAAIAWPALSTAVLGALDR